MASTATDEVGEKRQGIYLYQAYDLWSKQKEVYLSQQVVNAKWYLADEEFASHVLAVHASFCKEPCCSGSGTRKPAVFSSSLSPSQPGRDLAVSSRSPRLHDIESVETQPTVIVNTTADDTYDHCVTFTVSIDESEKCQDATSDVTQHSDFEQGQFVGEEFFSPTEIKTEPVDVHESEEMGNGSCPVISDSSGLSHDQQTGWMTDLTYKVKYEDDGHFGENDDHQLGGPIDTSQRSEALHYAAESGNDSPTATVLDPFGSSGIAKEPHECPTCHNILGRNGCPRCTFANQEDGRMLCDACLKEVDHADRVPVEQEDDSNYTKKPNESQQALNGMRNTHLQIGNMAGRRSFECEICQQTFTIGADLPGPKKSNMGEKPHKCKLCSVAFRNKSLLNIHMRKHTGEKPLKCNICSKAFRYTGTLNLHMRRHTGERPHKCNICPMTFCLGSTLRTHMRKHSSEKPFECSLCPSTFRSSIDLHRHMRIHTDERPHECKVCSKAFRQKGHLDTHMKTHSGEKPHKCKVCSKSFSRNSQLTSHMRLHTEEKPFKCQFCPNAFCWAGNLRRHTRTHTGEKPFQCQRCPSAFCSSGDLSRHMRIHTGERPYKCHLCAKAFHNQSGLHSHMRTHTGEKPFKCNLCPSGYTRKDSLSNHMKTHTEENPSECNVIHSFSKAL